MSNVIFKTGTTPFTESQIRKAMQETIKEFIQTGGEYESYSDGPGGSTLIVKKFPELGTEILALLSEGAVEISLRVIGDNGTYADAQYYPKSEAWESDEGYSEDINFFKAELEMLQTAIDNSKLVDYFGKHYIRPTAEKSKSGKMAYIYFGEAAFLEASRAAQLTLEMVNNGVDPKQITVLHDEPFSFDPGDLVYYFHVNIIASDAKFAQKIKSKIETVASKINCEDYHEATDKFSTKLHKRFEGAGETLADDLIQVNK